MVENIENNLDPQEVKTEGPLKSDCKIRRSISNSKE